MANPKQKLVLESNGLYPREHYKSAIYPFDKAGYENRFMSETFALKDIPFDWSYVEENSLFHLFAQRRYLGKMMTKNDVLQLHPKRETLFPFLFWHSNIKVGGHTQVLTRDEADALSFIVPNTFLTLWIQMGLFDGLLNSGMVAPGPVTKKPGNNFLMLIHKELGLESSLHLSLDDFCQLVVPYRTVSVDCLNDVVGVARNTLAAKKALLPPVVIKDKDLMEEEFDIMNLIHNYRKRYIPTQAQKLLDTISLGRQAGIEPSPIVQEYEDRLISKVEATTQPGEVVEIEFPYFQEAQKKKVDKFPHLKEDNKEEVKSVTNMVPSAAWNKVEINGKTVFTNAETKEVSWTKPFQVQPAPVVKKTDPEKLEAEDDLEDGPSIPGGYMVMFKEEEKHEKVQNGPIRKEKESPGSPPYKKPSGIVSIYESPKIKNKLLPNFSWMSDSQAIELEYMFRTQFQSSIMDMGGTKGALWGEAFSASLRSLSQQLLRQGGHEYFFPDGHLKEERVQIAYATYCRAMVTHGMIDVPLPRVVLKAGVDYNALAGFILGKKKLKKRFGYVFAGGIFVPWYSDRPPVAPNYCVSTPQFLMGKSKWTVNSSYSCETVDGRIFKNVFYQDHKQQKKYSHIWRCVFSMTQDPKQSKYVVVYGYDPNAGAVGLGYDIVAGFAEDLPY